MEINKLQDIHASTLMNDPVTVLKVTADVPDWELGLHQHDYGQLMATQSGLITISTVTGIWVVPPKTAIWIPPNISHSSTGIGLSSCFMVFTQKNLFDHSECHVIQVSDFLNSLFLRTEEIKPNFTSHSAEARLMQVLVDEIISAPQQSQYLPLPSDKRLKMITDSLLHQPEQKTSLAQWAKQCGMSERSLTRTFKGEMKLSLNHWRRRLHITLALQKLNDGRSITYIANELGYVSDSSFITMFKKAMKSSPKKFYSERQIKLDDPT
ncbi:MULTISPECIES: AraC family transcriptional regulator [unclassified Acinetobacter]|uniref:AraC family transcriptional regulator n=2 Tax=Moraxellaceae TaxID=468 RepID=UPI000B092AEE|nr:MULTISPECIES: AraC family transcriptional regulator [unclassified Acinetobacter]